MFRHILLFIASTLLCGTAYADSLNLSLANPNQAAIAGQTLTYTGTLTADAGVPTEYLYGIAISLNASDGSDVSQQFALDGDAFYNNFPFQLDAGTTLTDVLFTIELPGNVSGGSFYGMVTLQGGSNPTSQDIIASAPFSIMTTAVTPEPASFYLAGTGLLLIVLSVVSRSRGAAIKKRAAAHSSRQENPVFLLHRPHSWWRPAS